MKTDIYNKAGEKSGTIEMPESVFGLPWNDALVHQVVVSMQANARTPVAHVKDRSEVAGGGRKPWRQKGTGRARHGSIRSPLWRGGGTTHAPRSEKRYAKSINKKMRAKALHTILSRKFREGEIICVDSLTFEEPKTSEAKSFLSALAKTDDYGALNKKRNAALIAMERDPVVAKSFNNFGNVAVAEVRNLNPVDVLRYKYLILVDPERSIQQLAKRGMKTSADVGDAETAHVSTAAK